MKEDFMFFSKVSFVTFFSLFLINNGFSQLNASISGEVLELDKGLIVTDGMWGGYRNVISMYVSNRKSLWVEDNEINKWVKSYNKIKRTNYQFVSRGINKNQLVLATEEYLKSSKNKISTAGICADRLSDLELNIQNASLYPNPYIRARRELLFLDSNCYRVSLNKEINFKFEKLSESVSMFTNKTPSDGRLNGKWTVRLFDNIGGSTIGYYQGGMKNGLPDDYGIYIRKCDSCMRGYIRKGFWNAGIFSQEKEASILEQELRKVIFKNENPIGLKALIEEASFNCDPLLPEQSSGYLLIVNYTWLNNSQKDRQLRVALIAPDFTEEPIIKVVNKDAWPEIDFVRQQQYAKQNDLLLRMLGFGKNIGKQMAERNISVYDDYLRFYIPNWTSIGRPADYEYRYGDDMDLTTVYVDVRKKRSENWKEVGAVKVFRRQLNPVNEKIRTEYSSFLGYEFLPEYESVSQIVQALIPVIKRAYPNPTEDTTSVKVEKIPEKNKVGWEKLEMIKKRLINSRYFNYKNGDSLTGIWQDNDGLYVLDNNKKAFYAIFPYRLEQYPYQMATHIRSFEIKQNNIIVFGVQDSVRTELKKFQIQRITQNEIRFQEGLVWKRIN